MFIPKFWEPGLDYIALYSSPNSPKQSVGKGAVLVIKGCWWHRKTWQLWGLHDRVSP